MREITDLDKTIVQTAKRMILEKGILDTDMKDIAREIGCSRSTLYRHFASKGEILLILADEALEVIREAQVIPPEYRFSTGYEAFVWQLNAMLDAALNHVDAITFLRDFDCLYYQIEDENQPKGQWRDTSAESPLQESYNRGVEDGSIEPAADGTLFVLSTIQGFIALAERVLPLEKGYIDAFGYGQEILRAYLHTVAEAIRIR